MIVVLVLGIHFLLLSVYAGMIQSNRSRLSMTYLLLALFLPFVGELCLVVAEMGKVPAVSKYSNRSYHDTNIPLRPNNFSIPTDWKEIVLGEEKNARLLLMNVIDNAPEAELAEVLKTALHSKSSEVSHIAAAGLMRLNKKYENAITIARDASIARENNVMMLASYFDAINAYIKSGLPDEHSCYELKETEIKLLSKYLMAMPQDEYYLSLQENLLSSEAITDE